jgi:endonuclease YncB( thermonuclease family)
MRAFRNLCLVVSILVVTPSAMAGTAEVLTAETLRVGAVSYRLVGIDAPEDGQRCWLESHLFDCAEIAKAALTDLVTGASVACEEMVSPEAAKDGLPVALCRSDGYDLSEGMAYTGWALADPITGARYRAFEEGARHARRGLWRGRFVQPWDWRDGARLPEELAD